MPLIRFDINEQITPLEKIVTSTRRSLIAAMETGNHEYARTLLNELGEHSDEKAQELRLDVKAAYGVHL